MSTAWPVKYWLGSFGTAKAREGVGLRRAFPTVRATPRSSNGDLGDRAQLDGARRALRPDTSLLTSAAES